MNIMKKLIGSCEKTSGEAPVDVHLMEAYRNDLIALFHRCDGAFAPVSIINALSFVMRLEGLLDRHIKAHCDLYDYLAHERDRIESEHHAAVDRVQSSVAGDGLSDEEWMEKLAENQAFLDKSMHEIEVRYEEDLKTRVEVYDESEAYGRLSELYLIVLSLRTMSYCHYWPDTVDAAQLRTKCTELLERMYEPLVTHFHPFGRQMAQRFEHPSELPKPDFQLDDDPVATGIASWPCKFHVNENQDYVALAPGVTVVLDGVSVPPSHEASRELGDFIRDRISRELPANLRLCSLDPFADEFRSYVFELLYRIVREGVANIRDAAQATTLALNVVIRVNKADLGEEPAYMLFTLHYGDSETLLYDPSTGGVTPLNPLLTLQDFTPEQLAFETSFVTWSPNEVVQHLMIPKKRDFSDPGFTLQKDQTVIPGYGTFVLLDSDAMIFTFTDGFRDNFNHFRVPIEGYRYIAKLIQMFSLRKVTKTQMAFALTALSKLHNAHCDLDFLLHGDASQLSGKEDDVTVVVQSVADSCFEYCYSEPHLSRPAPVSADGLSSKGPLPDKRPKSA